MKAKIELERERNKKLVKEQQEKVTKMEQETERNRNQVKELEGKVKCPLFLSCPFALCRPFMRVGRGNYSLYKKNIYIYIQGVFFYWSPLNLAMFRSLYKIPYSNFFSRIYH